MNMDVSATNEIELFDTQYHILIWVSCAIVILNLEMALTLEIAGKYVR